MNNSRPRCDFTGKVMFKDYIDAKLFLINFNRGITSKKWHGIGELSHVYKCQFCKHYHTSSQIDKQKNKKRR